MACGFFLRHAALCALFGAECRQHLIPWEGSRLDNVRDARDTDEEQIPAGFRHGELPEAQAGFGKRQGTSRGGLVRFKHAHCHGIRNAGDFHLSGKRPVFLPEQTGTGKEKRKGPRGVEAEFSPHHVQTRRARQPYVARLFRPDMQWRHDGPGCRSAVLRRHVLTA